MSRKVVLLMTWVIVFIGMVSVTISTEISVGVKEGDWMEYKVTVTGTLPSTYPIWIKAEILSIHGTTVIFEATVNMSDGTQDTQIRAVNVATGSGGWFIIPANLKNGDTFYTEDYGNMTISGVETSTYAGVSRTVVHATISPYGVTTTVYWDQSTGVEVEESTLQTDYSFFMHLKKTNMWQPQPFGLPIDPTVFYILIITAVVIAVAVAFFVITRRKKPAEEIVPPPQT